MIFLDFSESANDLNELYNSYIVYLFFEKHIFWKFWDLDLSLRQNVQNLVLHRFLMVRPSRDRLDITKNRLYDFLYNKKLINKYKK